MKLTNIVQHLELFNSIFKTEFSAATDLNATLGTILTYIVENPSGLDDPNWDYDSISKDSIKSTLSLTTVGDATYNAILDKMIAENTPLVPSSGAPDMSQLIDESITEESLKAFLTDLIITKGLGQGFHIDNDFADYINNETGQQTFTEAEANIYNDQMNTYFSWADAKGIDIYEVALDIMNGDETEPIHFIYVAYDEDGDLSVGVRYTSLSGLKLEGFINDLDDPNEFYRYINVGPGQSIDYPEYNLSIKWLPTGYWEVKGTDFDETIAKDDWSEDDDDDFDGAPDMSDSKTVSTKEEAVQEILDFIRNVGNPEAQGFIIIRSEIVPDTVNSQEEWIAYIEANVDFEDGSSPSFIRGEIADSELVMNELLLYVENGSFQFTYGDEGVFSYDVSSDMFTEEEGYMDERAEINDNDNWSIREYVKSYMIGSDENGPYAPDMSQELQEVNPNQDVINKIYEFLYERENETDKVFFIASAQPTQVVPNIEEYLQSCIVMDFNTAPSFLRCEIVGNVINFYELMTTEEPKGIFNIVGDIETGVFEYSPNIADHDFIEFDGYMDERAGLTDGEDNWHCAELIKALITEGQPQQMLVDEKSQLVNDILAPYKDSLSSLIPGHLFTVLRALSEKVPDLVIFNNKEYGMLGWYAETGKSGLDIDTSNNLEFVLQSPDNYYLYKKMKGDLPNIKVGSDVQVSPDMSDTQDVADTDDKSQIINMILSTQSDNLDEMNTNTLKMILTSLLTSVPGLVIFQDKNREILGWYLLAGQSGIDIEPAENLNEVLHSHENYLEFMKFAEDMPQIKPGSDEDYAQADPEIFDDNDVSVSKHFRFVTDHGTSIGLHANGIRWNCIVEKDDDNINTFIISFYNGNVYTGDCTVVIEDVADSVVISDIAWSLEEYQEEIDPEDTLIFNEHLIALLAEM